MRHKKLRRRICSGTRIPRRLMDRARTALCPECGRRLPVSLTSPLSVTLIRHREVPKSPVHVIDTSIPKSAPAKWH